MQASSASGEGEEENGRLGKVSKGTEKKLIMPRKKINTIWTTLSKARRSMICLPHPAAVCSNVRTRITGPVAQREVNFAFAFAQLYSPRLMRVNKIWVTENRGLIIDNSIVRETRVSLARSRGVGSKLLLQVQPVSFREQVEFLEWLKERGQEDACQSTTVGISAHGRALFATRPIQCGERVLRVSHDLLITPNKLPKEVLEIMLKDVSEWARLALFIIAEQHKGQTSMWAPYINCLPLAGSIHSTVFWKKEELELLRHSSLHRETAQRKAIIQTEYSAVQPILQRLPHVFGDHVMLEDFRHAYATVCSRAWGIEALQTLALVPFVDFFNHDSYCQALLSYDEDQGCAEVVADREYTPGSQVVLSYGRLPNSILALDFGFTLADNPHDQSRGDLFCTPAAESWQPTRDNAFTGRQSEPLGHLAEILSQQIIVVEIWMGISRRDELRKAKLELLHSHDMPTFFHADGSDSGGSGFNVREVRSSIGRGKGIPHSLRAFARVVCAASSQEIQDMASEAADHDGRLCRRPLKNRNREAQAMGLLLARLESMMQQRHAALLATRLVESCRLKGSPTSVHAHMAGDVISGEMRVLRSAILWLRNHCNPSTVLT